MRPVRHLPSYTYSDYLLWEGDWELIDGIPYSMSPSATGKHQWLASLLTTEIVLNFRSNTDSCGDCISVQDVDWIIDDQTVLRPDLAVVCYPLTTFITAPPALVVEILSPSSGHHDRIIKHEIYEEQKVKYYIILDPAAGTYNAYQLVQGKYENHTSNSYKIHDECTLVLDIASTLSTLNK